MQEFPSRALRVMNISDVRSGLLKILAQVVPDTDLGEIHEELPISNQVELDSLTYLEFLLEIREAYGIEIPSTDYHELLTLRRAAQYLLDRLNAATIRSC